MQIVVDKELLEKKLNGSELKYIELCIVPAEMDAGHYHPAFLHVGGILPNGTYKDLEGVIGCELLNQFVKKSA